jgi:hypothetical protein
VIGLDTLTNALGDRSCAFGRPTRYHHREFFAAEARVHIEDVYGSTQDLGDIPYHEISSDVPKAIVDALEAIEVNHNNPTEVK